MNEAEIKQRLDYILANGDSSQKKVISKCLSVVHYEVRKKNDPNNRKNFEDYKIRIERVFTYGTNEQISSLIGNLLVQEFNVQANPAHEDKGCSFDMESQRPFQKPMSSH